MWGDHTSGAYSNMRQTCCKHFSEHLLNVLEGNFDNSQYVVYLLYNVPTMVFLRKVGYYVNPQVPLIHLIPVICCLWDDMYSLVYFIVSHLHQFVTAGFISIQPFWDWYFSVSQLQRQRILINKQENYRIYCGNRPICTPNLLQESSPKD